MYVLYCGDTDVSKKNDSCSSHGATESLGAVAASEKKKKRIELSSLS